MSVNTLAFDKLITRFFQNNHSEYRCKNIFFLKRSKCTLCRLHTLLARAASLRLALVIFQPFWWRACTSSGLCLRLRTGPQGATAVMLNGAVYRCVCNVVPAGPPACPPACLTSRRTLRQDSLSRVTASTQLN